MKRTIMAVLLVLAIAAVGYWGAAGWQNQNREWHRMQAACEETKRENRAGKRTDRTGTAERRRQ